MKPRLVSFALLLVLPGALHARPRQTEDMSGAIMRGAAYDYAMKDAGLRYSVDPHLLWTIAYLESRFRPRLVSRKGARGLMQLMPATGRRYGLVSLNDLHDPLRSIDAAARYVSDLCAMFGGRVDLVLAGYNAGENAVISSGYRVPRYAETRSYVARGVSLFKRLRQSDLLSGRPPAETSPHGNEPVSKGRPTPLPAPSLPKPSHSIYFPL
jgi:hypothetical protein